MGSPAQDFNSVQTGGKRPQIWLSTLLIGWGMSVGLVACQQGLTHAEIEAMVEARLQALSPPSVDEQVEPPTAPTAAKSQAPPSVEAPRVVQLGPRPGLSERSVTRASETATFLARLDHLMAEYTPRLPALPTHDILQCATTARVKQDTTLSHLANGLVEQITAVERERTRLTTAFDAHVRAVNDRIDHDWQTRMRHDSNVYLYSDRAVAAAPELMTRMEASRTTEPERLFCVVSDMVTERRQESGEAHWLLCDTETTSPRAPGEALHTIQRARQGAPKRADGQVRLRLLLTSDRITVQAGDLVSAPLRGVSLPGHPVLRRDWTRERNRTWTLYAETGTVTVEEARTGCPDTAAVSLEVCRHADQHVPPLELVQHCMAGGEVGALYQRTRAWDRKNFKDKDQVMLLALVHLAGFELRKLPGQTSTSDDLWLRMALGRYKQASGDPVSAVASYHAALPFASQADDFVEIATQAHALGDAALAVTCVKKACELGERKACEHSGDPAGFLAVRKPRKANKPKKANKPAKHPRSRGLPEIYLD